MSRKPTVARRALTVVLPLLAVAAITAATTAPTAPSLPQPAPDDRCPVCGMLVAPHPEWLARVLYDDGTTLFFDGPKDLFRYLHKPARFRPDRAGRAVAQVLVTGYYAGRALPAGEALYVIGSDVLGPMGAELVPLASRPEAEEFRRDHGGRGILTYDEVTPELVAGLR